MKKTKAAHTLFLIITCVLLTACKDESKSVSSSPVIIVGNDTRTEPVKADPIKVDPITTEPETTEMEVLNEEPAAKEAEDIADEPAAAEEEIEKEEPIEKEEEESDDLWISSLSVANTSTQIITVVAKGNTAKLSLFDKSSGKWEELLTADAGIGSNGIGKTKEGDRKTPQGKYGFTMAFGTKDNPGSQISYTKVDGTYFWVDDSSSDYYNQFVTTNTTAKDWNSAESLGNSGSSYNYVLAVNYNSSNTPGKGSAIFVHCLPTGGAGCIAIPEGKMKELLTKVRPDCVLLIDSESGILNY